jgi:hypothetical protein
MKRMLFAFEHSLLVAIRATYGLSVHPVRLLPHPRKRTEKVLAPNRNVRVLNPLEMSV